MNNINRKVRYEVKFFFILYFSPKIQNKQSKIKVYYDLFSTGKAGGQAGLPPPKLHYNTCSELMLTHHKLIMTHYKLILSHYELILSHYELILSQTELTTIPKELLTSPVRFFTHNILL
jgi:hypothetical protein